MVVRRGGQGGQGGGGGGPFGTGGFNPFDFGKTGSKFQEVDQTGVTFADVAVRPHMHALLVIFPCLAPHAGLPRHVKVFARELHIFLFVKYA